MSIQSQIDRIIGLRDDSFDAVRAKGVTVPQDAALDDLPGYIGAISASPTLQTKSVTPSESAQTVTPDSGYDGLSSVSVGAVSSTYVGSGVTRKTAQTYTPGTTNQTISANQYLTGAQTISGDANLVAANIAEGVSIFGVTGTHSGGSTLPSATGVSF